MITFMPNARFIAIDEDGNPVAGGKLYTYAHNSSTPKTTYTNWYKATPNTNPIILDSNGECSVWIDADDGAYKFVLKDENDVVLWSMDGIDAPGGEIPALVDASGDLLYADGADSLTRLAKGTARQVLRMNSGATAPEWGAGSAGTLTTQGDLLIASAANVLARLGIGTARQVLQTNSGVSAPEWAASPQSVLTAAGDLLYASAANTLARLAKGSADQKLFMNAGGTAPAWGSGLKIGYVSHDTSTTGAVATTGVGFSPAIMLLFTQIGAATGEMSIGLDNGTNHYCISDDHNNNANCYTSNLTKSIYLDEGGGVYATGYVSAMGSDGFTITWAKAGAKTGTAYVFYLAIR